MFVYEWDMPPFYLKEFVVRSSLGGHLCCFSAVLHLYSPLWKAVSTSSLQQTRSTRQHVLPALNEHLSAYKFNAGFLYPSFLVHRLYKGLLSWVWKGKQIHIQTFTHTLEKNFSKHLLNSYKCLVYSGCKEVCIKTFVWLDFAFSLALWNMGVSEFWVLKVLSNRKTIIVQATYPFKF